MLVAVARVPLRALMRRPCPQRRAGGTRLGAARRAAEAALLLPLLLLLLPARAFLALLGAAALALRAAARARTLGREKSERERFRQVWNFLNPTRLGVSHVQCALRARVAVDECFNAARSGRLRLTLTTLTKKTTALRTRTMRTTKSMMTTTARKEAEHEEDNGEGDDVDGSNGDEGDGGSADVFVKTPRSWTMRAPAPPALLSLRTSPRGELRAAGWGAALNMRGERYPPRRGGVLFDSGAIQA